MCWRAVEKTVAGAHDVAIKEQFVPLRSWWSRRAVVRWCGGGGDQGSLCSPVRDVSWRVKRSRTRTTANPPPPGPCQHHLWELEDQEAILEPRWRVSSIVSMVMYGFEVIKQEWIKLHNAKSVFLGMCDEAEDPGGNKGTRGNSEGIR